MKLSPQTIIFDMDGVLVNTSQSFDVAIERTVKALSGLTVTYDDIFALRSQGGYNNDYVLTAQLLKDRGHAKPDAEVIQVFESIYMGENGDGLIADEPWVLSADLLRRISARYQPAIFTGRTRKEALTTLNARGFLDLFRKVVAEDDVSEGKPSPEGLLSALDGVDPASALHLGDTVDDAKAAAAAGAPFIGVIPPWEPKPEVMADKFAGLGVTDTVRDINELENRLAL